jgi:dihydrofolate reductase
MRTVTFGVACSLDGYIAREDHGVDWLQWSDDVAAITADVWASFDTVVMGRKTYEAALRGGTTAYPGVTNYVFSRTMAAAPDPAVRLVRDDAAKVVAELKAQPGEGICVMGGGELAASLFAADLIDVVGLNMHPVLLGSGIPLFHRLPRQLNLTLEECRPIQGGCVYMLHRVRR